MNYKNHISRTRLLCLGMILFMISILSACRVGDERFEVTQYMNKSVKTFEKRTGIELEQLNNGVFMQKDVVQLIAPKGDITSISVLKNAENLTLFDIGIGTRKATAEEKLYQLYGKENSNSINMGQNTITYYYLDNDNELYITYDLTKDSVKEMSYYIFSKKENEKEDTVSAGELIAMIGGTRVYYNEAMVYLKSVQQNYEAEFGKGIWNVDIFGEGKSFGNVIKEEVIRQITELKIIKDKANELGIVLSEEEMADAKAYAKEHYEGLTKEDINRYLISQELLERVYEDNLLAEKVFETSTINVDTVVSDFEAKQITIQHILIYSVSIDQKGNKVPLPADEKEQAYDNVKSLLERAKTTEDFYSLAEANTRAKGIEYTFGRGTGPKEYSTAFEQAAFTLKAGEVSDIITTDYGWHILYCVTDYNEDATTQVKEDMIEQRRNDMFSSLYKEWSTDYDVIVNSEAWDSVIFN